MPKDAGTVSPQKKRIFFTVSRFTEFSSFTSFAFSSEIPMGPSREAVSESTDCSKVDCA